jgi:hypothetical protein
LIARPFADRLGRKQVRGPVVRAASAHKSILPSCFHHRNAQASHGDAAMMLVALAWATTGETGRPSLASDHFPNRFSTHPQGQTRHSRRAPEPGGCERCGVSRGGKSPSHRSSSTPSAARRSRRPGLRAWSSGLAARRSFTSRLIPHAPARLRLRACEQRPRHPALQAYLGHRNIQHTVRYAELPPTRFKNLWRE